ncbi:MAG TPA: GAF domain-containing sensor histidine kinase, partial [Anaerolineales bacterium]|nr:GAF domain-containing sensor histidine kinase [Anaerolineales bacterium]
RPRRSPSRSESVKTAADPDRMRQLHRATLRLYADLSLDGTLRRIVQAARELTRARYAALGVPDGKGGLKTFITEGMTPEEVARLDHPPEGRGLIGEVSRSGRSIRLPDLTRHPRSSGFPEGHPPMRSFLGVPIAAFGRPVGQIYLTEKMGAEAFSEEDQSLIEMLAAHAAAAVENARLYQQVQEREGELAARNRELELLNSLSTAVSTAIDLEPLLLGILERVTRLFRAKAGEVFLRSDEGMTFLPTTQIGLDEAAFRESHPFRLGEGFLGRVAEGGRATSTANLPEVGQPRFLRRPGSPAPFASLVSVPLVARAQVVGVMSLAFDEPRSLRPDEIGLLEAVGAGVGVAADNARLYRQARRLAVLEERERIAMDLHDGIIQSIYAVGLTLDSAQLQLQTAPQESDTAMRQAIERLNGVIRDIRAYILDLQPSRVETDDLASALERLVNEFRANTLIEADLLTEDGLGPSMDPAVRAALFHISQEALANVGKHARASHVWVSLRRGEAETILQVIDNGQGFDAGATPARLGHGLSNIVERGHAIGGGVDILSSPGEGTAVTVRLPVGGPA